MGLARSTRATSAESLSTWLTALRRSTKSSATSFQTRTSDARPRSRLPPEDRIRCDTTISRHEIVATNRQAFRVIRVVRVSICNTYIYQLDKSSMLSTTERGAHGQIVSAPTQTSPFNYFCYYTYPTNTSIF